MGHEICVFVYLVQDCKIWLFHINENFQENFLEQTLFIKNYPEEKFIKLYDLKSLIFWCKYETRTYVSVISQ